MTYTEKQRSRDRARYATDQYRGQNRDRMARVRADERWGTLSLVPVASREVATTAPSDVASTCPELAEKGYALSEAMKPVDLPADPVSLLDCLNPYVSPAQRDLKVVQKTDSDGITTVTVTAVRDNYAEAAAELMATRIATGEGEHRCLAWNKDGSARVNLKGGMTPLFPLGTTFLRYQRFGQALARKLRAAAWELTGDRDHMLTFHRAGETPTDIVDRMLGPMLGDPEIEAELHHRTNVLLQGL